MWLHYCIVSTLQCLDRSEGSAVLYSTDTRNYFFRDMRHMCIPGLTPINVNPKRFGLKPSIFNFNQETKVSYHVSEVLRMTGAWCLKILQKYDLFKEMFKQCGFIRTFYCTLPNVLREVVSVPYLSWKVALGVQISFSCLPYVACGIHRSLWSSHCCFM